MTSELVERMNGGAGVIAAELRPPRAELEAGASIDAWIDTYHAVRGLTRNGTFVFLTDSAVGLREEDNLRHLVINLGSDVPRSHVVPFLTSKHPLDYCLSYADRAWKRASARSSSLAGIGMSVHRDASSMRGNCGGTFARACRALPSAAGRT